MTLGCCGGLKIIKAIFWLGFNIWLCWWSFSDTAKIRDEFEAILDATHDPQIYLVSADEYWSPVHIICSTNSDCDEVRKQYKSITTTQSYFTMNWMDTRDDDATISDILDARTGINTWLWVFIFGAIIGNCCGDCAQTLEKEKHDKWLEKLDKDNRNVFKVSKVINATMAVFMLKVYKMTVCNIFSVSEVAEGVLLLQYFPGYMLIASFIVSLILAYCICYGSCSAFAAYANNDKGCGCIIICCCIILPFVVLFVLFSIPYWGLSFYALQFNYEYASSSFGLLSPSYVDTTDGLASLAVVFGIGSWFETVMTFIDQIIYALIDTAKPYYTR
eukprot:426648_1